MAFRKLDRPAPAELTRLYVDEQLGAPEIARQVGCDPTTVRAWLLAAGVEMRPRGSDPRQHFRVGERSAFAGRRHTPETRERIRAATVARGGVPYLRDGVHHLAGVTGPDHPSWQGGLTPERQLFSRSAEWKQACRAVWNRDERCCRRCGCRPPSRGPEHLRGHVHHILPFRVVEVRLDLDNLVLLCAGCHRWVHSRANVERLFLPDLHQVAS